MVRAAHEDVIEAGYEAATAELPWTEFSTRLERLVGADSVSLWIGGSAGVNEFLHAPPHHASLAGAYTRHYHSTDLWVAAARRVTTGLTAKSDPVAFLGSELVPETAFRKSEFHADFCRPLGLHHLLGTVLPLGEAGTLAIGCHSGADRVAFEEPARARLVAVLPHLRRALQLRQRILPRHAVAGFEAMPTPALVVDAEMRILSANAAAEAALQRGGVCTVRSGRTTRLTAEYNTDATALARCVRQVALSGHEGGTVPLARPEGGPVLALVLPLPGTLLGQGNLGLLQGRALVVLKDPLSPSPMTVHRLRELYDLSPAEAEVVIAASAGQTAVRIALIRGVSVTTVRTQIRSALRKTGAETLRQLSLLVGNLG